MIKRPTEHQIERLGLLIAQEALKAALRHIKREQERANSRELSRQRARGKVTEEEQEKDRI